MLRDFPKPTMKSWSQQSLKYCKITVISGLHEIQTLTLVLERIILFNFVRFCSRITYFGLQEGQLENWAARIAVAPL